MPSIGVLEHYQSPTDKPKRRMKKSGGQSHVRRRAAEWIIENVLLRMLPPKSVTPIKSCRLPAKAYIPKDLPKQYELPGMIFKLKSDPHIAQREASLARLANQLYGN